MLDSERGHGVAVPARDSASWLELCVRLLRLEAGLLEAVDRAILATIVVEHISALIISTVRARKAHLSLGLARWLWRAVVNSASAAHDVTIADLD